MNTAAVVSQFGANFWLILPVLSLSITAAVMVLIEDY
jgi:hypothetical protein